MGDDAPFLLYPAAPSVFLAANLALGEHVTSSKVNPNSHDICRERGPRSDAARSTRTATSR